MRHDLLNATEVREFFGGTRLITVSALYRGMATGRYPRPVHVGGARWVRSECEAALAALIVTRDAALADADRTAARAAITKNASEAAM